MPASIFSNVAVKILKNILRFKDNNEVISTTTNPLTTGWAAPVGSVLYKTDTAQTYQKTGANNTDWTEHVDATRAQTVAGVKTFSSSPVVTGLSSGNTIAISDTLKTSLTSIDNAIRDTNHTGWLSWDGAGNYYSISGATLNILRPGTGRIRGAYTTWAGTENVTLSANKSYYICISATNTISAIDAATIVDADKLVFATNLAAMMVQNIMLFSAWCDKDSIITLITRNNHPYTYTAEIASHDHLRLGSVFLFNGAVINPLSAANRQIDLLGNDLIDDHGVYTNVPDSTGTAIDTIAIWRNAAGYAQRLYRKIFTVSGVSVTPTVGATYTQSGSTYTVTYTTIVAGSGTVYAWRSTGSAEPSASGTLTKASGTGDASITYSAVIANRVVPVHYSNAGVPTLLGTGGATRYGIYAIYALPNDFQTPSTAAPLPFYIAVLSTAAYSSTTNAANSIGTAANPSLTQFVVPAEIITLEPVLLGFVITDGSTRAIPTVSTNGFVNGVRSFKQTASTSGSAGAVAVADAVNVSTATAGFDSWLSATDTDVQTALSTLDETGKDGTFRLSNTASLTKKIAFSAASISAGQTRTVTVPDRNFIMNDIRTTTTTNLTGFLKGDGSVISVALASETITPWVSWTPTGSWTTNTTYTGKKRRVGSNGEYVVKVAMAGKPNVTDLRVVMPTGETFNTTDMVSADTNQQMGTAALADQNLALFYGTVGYYSTTQVYVNYASEYGDGGPLKIGFSVTDTAPTTWENTDYIILKWTGPVTFA